MKNLTCIVCPIGCSLEVEESGGDLLVTGNKCPRGADYAREEILAPKRIVTATCLLDGGDVGSVRRIPVKTVTPCLRDKIPALLTDIYKVKISLPVKVGDIVISDWNGEGIDVVATRAVG